MTRARAQASVPPPVMLAGAFGVQRAMTRHRPSTPASRVLAAVIAGASAALAVSAVSTLAQADTELSPANPERARVLVTSGPFRRTRNPIYLALAGVLVAHAVLRRSARALIPVAAFVAVINRTQIPAEEDALSSRFGKKYASYRRATPRWIGPAEE